VNSNPKLLAMLTFINTEIMRLLMPSMNDNCLGFTEL
jgi:hypothetical protein